MRQSIRGVFARIKPHLIERTGDPLSYCFVLEEFEKHLLELSRRFYAGDQTVVDEFLQLYDLDCRMTQTFGEIAQP
jgi:hypothetical protein